jgi:hypothetical protein
MSTMTCSHDMPRRRPGPSPDRGAPEVGLGRRANHRQHRGGGAGTPAPQEPRPAAQKLDGQNRCCTSTPPLRLSAAWRANGNGGPIDGLAGGGRVHEKNCEGLETGIPQRCSSGTSRDRDSPDRMKAEPKPCLLREGMARKCQVGRSRPTLPSSNRLS